MNVLPTQQAANEEHRDGVEIVGKCIQHIPKEEDDATKHQGSKVGLIGPSTQVNRRKQLGNSHRANNHST